MNVIYHRRKRVSNGHGGRLFFSVILKASVLFSLLSCHTVSAVSQWRLLYKFNFGNQNQTPIVCFLGDVGKPLVGFYAPGLLKTIDGGYTWKTVSIYGGFATDITFKDSLTGWFCEYRAIYKTTDGGESWFQVGPLSELSDVDGIYYDKVSGGLFVANNTYGLVSWDEGTTWGFSADVGNNPPSGFAFINGDSGIQANIANWPPSVWFQTSDGGHTWTWMNFDSVSWQPLAIPGTQTYFVNTVWGNIMRSDDAGITWQNIYTFPPQFRLPNGAEYYTSSGCIRGTLDSLFVMVCSGCYLSIDQGVSWKYLCGVRDLVDPIQRFWVVDRRIYAIGVDTLENPTTLWMLNLDSLNTFATCFSFPDSTKRLTLPVGNKVTVNFSPQTTDPIGVDSGHIVIHFDSTSLLLDSLALPPSWVIRDSTSGPDYLDLFITADSSQPLPNPIITLTFKTYLSSSTSAKVYLDSAHLYGQRLNCDCAALSVSGPDSVQIVFEGCGDATLLAAMNHAPPFSIESIQPNPAGDEITVQLSGNVQPEIEMYDALGRSVLTTPQPPPIPLRFIGGGVTLDVSSVPSGIYFLRVSAGGYVESRSVVIQH